MAGQAILNLLEKDIRPKDIMTKPAFENAITLIMALGGALALTDKRYRRNRFAANDAGAANES